MAKCALLGWHRGTRGSDVSASLPSALGRQSTCSRGWCFRRQSMLACGLMLVDAPAIPARRLNAKGLSTLLACRAPKGVGAVVPGASITWPAEPLAVACASFYAPFTLLGSPPLTLMPAQPYSHPDITPCRFEHAPIPGCRS